MVIFHSYVSLPEGNHLHHTPAAPAMPSSEAMATGSWLTKWRVSPGTMGI